MSANDILNQAFRVQSAPVSNLLSGIQAGQALQARGLQNQLLQGQVAQQPLQTQLLQQRLAAGDQAAQASELAFTEAQKAAGLKAITNLALEASLLPEDRRAAYVRQNIAGVDMFGSQMAEEIQELDDSQILQAINQLNPQAQAPKFTGVDVDTDSGMVIYTNKNTGDVVTTPISQFNSGDVSPKDFREFQKETRTSIRSDLKAVNKQAQELSSSRNKIQALINQASKGNRSAIGAVIMNLAKLNSPGVVTDQDFATVAGAGNPIAEAISLLSGKGVDVDAVLRGIDPTNPDNFDAASVVDTANSLITSQIPNLNSQLEGLRTRGTTAELPQQQLDTLFSGTDFVSDILTIQAPPKQLTVDEQSRLEELRGKM